MPSHQPEILLRHIRQLVDPGPRVVSDRDLLRRFTAQGDAGAFEALVRRHGPMVFGVCRRLLPNVQDAEDVFQATFLVLTRKAPVLCWRESIGAWLYEVAGRLAREARTLLARRARHESRVAARPPGDALAEITCREARAVFDEELQRLPERYRAPLVLCLVEGMTRDEAARQLGWSLATLKRRLARGRALLRASLERRGITPFAALPGIGFVEPAALPGPLVEAAVRAATALEADAAVVAGIPAKVVALAETVSKSTVLARVLIGLVVSGLVAVTAGSLALSTASPERALAVIPPPGRQSGAAAAEPSGATEQPETPRTVTLRGQVVDAAGRPVAGAVVFLRQQPTARNSETGYATKTPDVARTTADGEGRFVFEGAVLPTPDKWRGSAFPLDVIALAKGHGLGWQHLEAPNPSRPLRILLAPEGQLRGRVVDPDGKAVAGVMVRVREIAGLDDPLWPSFERPGYLDLQWSEVPLMATSDAQGHFVLSGLPRQVRVALTTADPRFLREDLYAATTDRPQPKLINDDSNARGEQTREHLVHTGALTITVQPACRLHGRVIFADTGKPAVNARWPEPPIVSPPQRTVDADGRFVLEQLKPGTLFFHVYPPEGSDYLGLVEQVEIKAGQRDVERTFPLPRGVRVTGRVVDDVTGKGIAGATIHYVPSESPTGNPRPLTSQVKTEADGSFRWAVPPGPGKLIVYGLVAGYQTPIWSGSLDDAGEHFVWKIDVHPNQAVPEVRFTLSRGRVMAGRAVDPGGRPLAGARIQITRSKENSSLPEPDRVTDSEGKFTLSGINPDEEAVVVLRHPQRRLAAQVRFSGGQDEKKPEMRDVVLRPLGAVAGQVLGEDQKPRTEAIVHLSRETTRSVFGEVEEPVATDAEGRFSFTSLVSGARYLVRVHAQGYTEAFSQPLLAEAGKTHSLPALTLRRTDQSITGRVVDPTGLPLAGVRVSAGDRRGVTDSQGRFQLTELPREDVNLWATVPGVNLMFHLGRVPAGSRDLNLELDLHKQ
jgi:RNA polymerase sigma factor (sigma-70 family)